MTSHRINKNLPASDILTRDKDPEQTIDEKSSLLAQYDRKDIRWLVDFAYNCDTTKLPPPPEFRRSICPTGIDYMIILSALPRIETALKHQGNPVVWNKSMTLVLENVTGTEADLLFVLFSGRKFDGVSKGYRVYFTDGEPVAVSTQTGRKMGCRKMQQPRSRSLSRHCLVNMISIRRSLIRMKRSVYGIWLIMKLPQLIYNYERRSKFTQIWNLVSYQLIEYPNKDGS